MEVMNKIEARLTTKLMKEVSTHYNEQTTLWSEVKVVERPRRFSTKVLSKKAKLLLQHTKLKYKFSDFSRTGTPLDFIYAPKVNTYLCVIFYKARQKSTAYFIKYDGTEYLASEEECEAMCDFSFSF